jgi:hypothetical protein
MEQGAVPTWPLFSASWQQARPPCGNRAGMQVQCRQQATQTLMEAARLQRMAVAPQCIACTAAAQLDRCNARMRPRLLADGTLRPGMPADLPTARLSEEAHLSTSMETVPPSSSSPATMSRDSSVTTCCSSHRRSGRAPKRMSYAVCRGSDGTFGSESSTGRLALCNAVAAAR